MNICPGLCLSIGAGAFDVCHKQYSLPPDCPNGTPVVEKKKNQEISKQTCWSPWKCEPKVLGTIAVCESGSGLVYTDIGLIPNLFPCGSLDMSINSLYSQLFPGEGNISDKPLFYHY